MRKSWALMLIAAACLGVGLAAGRLWRPDRSGAAGAVSSAEVERPPAAGDALPHGTDLERLRQEVAALREELQGEALARERLARRLEHLEFERAVESIAPDPDKGDDELTRPPAKRETPPSFDEQALRELDMAPSEITRLHERFDAFEMERLELIDRATREGWVRKPRFRQANQEHRWALQYELGNDVYDRLLYAVGQNNRVVVLDVLSFSPAEEVGILEGDEILRYDGERLFKASELVRATTEGRKGESIVVELLRNGQPLRIYLPRGPLGIRLRAERRPPLAEE